MTKDIEQLDTQDGIITHREQERQELGEAFTELRQTIIDSHPLAKVVLQTCDKAVMLLENLLQANTARTLHVLSDEERAAVKSPKEVNND